MNTDDPDVVLGVLSGQVEIAFYWLDWYRDKVQAGEELNDSHKVGYEYFVKFVKAYIVVCDWYDVVCDWYDDGAFVAKERIKVHESFLKSAIYSEYGGFDYA